MEERAVTPGLADIPMDMWQARLLGKHADTMDLQLLTSAYVCIAKFKAEVSNDERRELDDILNKIMDLMRLQPGAPE